jgi:hypothetical protein
MAGQQTNQERILAALRARMNPLDDDELSTVTGIRPRQTVNQICRALAEAGAIARGVGANGKLVNWIARPAGGVEPTAAESASVGESAAADQRAGVRVELVVDAPPVDGGAAADAELAVLPGSSGSSGGPRE